MTEFWKAFTRAPDGSWRCIEAITLHGPRGRIQVTVGSHFYRGTPFMGVDIARLLDEHTLGYKSTPSRR